MAGLAGKAGSIKLTTNTIAEVQDWSLDIGTDMMEDTALLNDWKSFVAGLKEWSASAESSWAVATDTNGQTAAQAAFLAGTTVEVRLYVDGTNYYSGNAYITGLSVSTEVSGIVTASWDFQGTGELSYN